jgi:hypothetical protein
LSFNFDELPSFTVTRIEIINKLNQRLYRINNPELTIPPMYPHMSTKKTKAPSVISIFVGYIVAGAVRTGLNLPTRLMSYTALRCYGNFANFPALSKVKVGWTADFYVGHDIFVETRFLDINHQDLSGAFLVNDIAKKNLFKIGATYPFMGGYWGERAHLVYDSSREWQRVEFVPRDAIRYYPDGETEVVEGGWNHEHCAICSQKISPYELDNEYGYQDQDDSWVCQACYEQYIMPKNLDFIIIDQVF